MATVLRCPKKSAFMAVRRSLVQQLCGDNTISRRLCGSHWTGGRPPCTLARDFRALRETVIGGPMPKRFAWLLLLMPLPTAMPGSWPSSAKIGWQAWRNREPGVYNRGVKRHLILALVLPAVFLAGCSKNDKSAAAAGTAPASSPASPAPAASNDAVQQKLQELAGSAATNCGRVETMSAEAMKTAGDCATEAAQKKQAFYVAYDLPGLTVGVAGNAEGKLYALQTEAKEGQPITAADVKTAPCPAELRLAASGRVTCLPAGSMSMGSSGASPHGGMPPASGPNPHGGATPAPKKK